MNHGTFVGRVGQDAEVRYTSSGKAVADFSIAIDNGKDERGTKRPPTWLKAVLWEKKAEALAKYITKGKMVAVAGRVSAEAWNDRQSGDPKCKVVVTVNDFTFCGDAKREDDGQDSAPAPAQAAQPNAGPITDEDIPF